MNCTVDTCKITYIIFVITLRLSSSASVNFSYFHLLLWNHWTDLDQKIPIVSNGKLLLPCGGHLGYAIGTKITNLVEDHPVIISIMLQFHQLSVILVQIGNPTWLPGPIMCSNWLILWKSSCQKLLSWWNCNIIEMMTGWSSKFHPIRTHYWPWQPCWISDLHQNNISGVEPSKEHSYNNCNIIEMMTGWSSTTFVIFVPIAYPRWQPQGNLVCHWTLLPVAAILDFRSAQ
jgi:hypothetical protein